ncbi:MAG: hypothetical protein DWQ40_06280 [Actinobacteria bacterium]|nr:MAG: hypothetical protein DWQ40_06280 [Actinomycetota bacterium]
MGWPAVIAIAGVSLIIFIILNPWLLLTSTTPTGGDMGAHVFGPAFLRDTLLPEGRILGWSDDWFAGFPAFYFYFPLPSLTIVLLDLILPYGVAFKLVTVLGLIGLPFAAYFHARCIGLSRSVSVVAATSGAIFAFMESFNIFGGNIASSLAGEFSYSWSFALSLVYLGLLIRGVRDDRRYLKWAALALALTALSHILTTLVIVFASLFVLGWKKGVTRAPLVWVWGFAIAAFWALPLLARIGLTSDMAWTPLSRLEEIFPVELWLLLPLAIAGAVWAVRRSTSAVPLIAATLLPVIYYPLPNVLPELLPEIFDGQRWKLWNGRLLPYWYFGVAFFAAVAVGAAVVWASRRLPSRASIAWVRGLIVLVTAVGAGLAADAAEFPDWVWTLFVAGGMLLLVASLWWGESVGTRDYLVSFAVVVLALGALSGVTFVDGWAKWNYEGYEAKGPWPEYEALMIEIDSLPDGRVQWEGNSEWNQYGTPMSPMLIPYWTQDSHESMEGLYFESSLTTPFHFINSSEMSLNASNPIPGLRYNNFQLERGLKHLDLYGVSYYVNITPEAGQAADELESMTKIAESGPFGIFALPETQLVEAAEFVPSVYEVPERGPLAALIGSETVIGADGEPLPSFHDMALQWYDDVDNLDLWVVADGPESWPRIESLDEREAVPTGAPEDAVSDISFDDHRISFRTEAVGVPHLVKMSYFPNWEATGADGPFRATPSLMVVVPTAEDVVIEFNDTWAETGGKVLTVLGVLALVAVVVAIEVRRRRGHRTDGASS